MKRARTDTSKENRRNLILSCAEKIITKEGLAGLSLKKVAAKSKLAIGTIYLYFEKKEDLIAQLTLKSREFLLDRFENSIQTEGNALLQLTKLLEAYYSFYIEFPHYNELVSFFESNVGLEEPDELVQASARINEIVVLLLKTGKKEGVIRQDVDEPTFSFLLWGTTVGIIQLIEVKKARLQKTLKMEPALFYQQHILMIINSIKNNS